MAVPEGQKMVTFQVSKELAHRARVAAAVLGESQSSLIRRALEKELAHLDARWTGQDLMVAQNET